MALYRHVQVEFWTNPKVLEEMSPEDKLLFLYLLTNQSTTQIGIYKITKKQIAFETGYSLESVKCIMERFEKKHKTIKYNENTREIAIKNWGKYNGNRLGKPVIDCIVRDLKKVDDKSLVRYVMDSIQNEKIKNLYLQAIENENIETKKEMQNGKPKHEKIPNTEGRTNNQRTREELLEYAKNL